MVYDFRRCSENFVQARLGSLSIGDMTEEGRQ